MGVIRRQAFKTSLIKIIGTGIGALSMFFVYSSNKELYGLYNFLFPAAALITPFIYFGAPAIATKFHPKNIPSPEKYRGVFLFLLSILLFGSTLAIIVFFAFQELWEDLFIKSGDDPLLQKYIFWILPLAILLGLRGILINYITNHGRIVIPEIISPLGQKITIPVLILLTALGIISVHQFVQGMLCMILVMNILLFAYLFRFEKQLFEWPKFALDFRRLAPVLNFGGFTFLNSLGSLLVVKLDSVMIGKMIDLTNVGAYNFLLFLTNIILIPKGSIYPISAPIVSRNIQKDNLEEVQKIYTSASIAMMIGGLFIAGLIVLNTQDIIRVLPDREEFVGYMGVVIFLSLTHLSEMSTSLNTHIIIFSRYYRFNLYAVVALGLANVLFNLYFIPRYGITGAAISTFLAMTIYNLVKLIFIYVKFNMQPFTIKNLYVLLIAIVSFGIVYYIPMTGSPWIDIFIRSIIFSTLYLPVVIYLRLSDDFNSIVFNVFSRIKDFFD